MTGATLFRTNGPSWRFEPDGAWLTYTSPRGTQYAIFAAIHHGRPLGVYRWSDRDCDWIPAAIGAEYIQFDDRSEFWFGGKPK
jgi:hypothetical protein